MEEFEDKIRRMVEGVDANQNDSNAEDKEFQQILDGAKNWKTPERKSKDESWSQLEQVIKKTGAGEPEKITTRPYMAIAATISLLIVSFIAYYILSNQTAIESTQVAETKTFYLPDSSKVILNALSSIEYSKSSFLVERILSLNGQAYFDVKKGSTFVINTGSITTEVLGTSFDIYSREGNLEVNCISGMVKVSGTSHALTLSKGEKVKATNNSLSKKKSNFNLDKAISWIQGEFYYDNTALSIVINEIEVQFDVQIKGEDFTKRYYTGYFDSKKLENALKQVLIPMGYTYDLKDKSVIVSKN
jgi:transmembrane sensor